MGIIIGLGGGDCNGDSENIYSRFIEFTGKANPRVLVLPTARRDEPDSDLEEAEFFISRGCDTSFLRLTDETLTKEEAEKAIDGADIIFVGGGNLKFLMDVWKRTGADKMLIKAYNNGKVLGGTSSGMMCWFAEGYDDCGEDGAFMFVDAVGIIPFSSCPHFESGSWGSYEQAVCGRPYSGFGIENGAALICRDGELSVMSGTDGGRIYLFDKDNGHIKEVYGGEAKKDNEI